jgi:phage shock protein C
MWNIYRSKTNRMIAGTIGGISEHFNLDAKMVRIIYVILIIITRHFILGLLIYAVCTCLLPEDTNNNHHNAENKQKRKNLKNVEEYDHK